MTQPNGLSALKTFAERFVGPLDHIVDSSRQYGRRSVMWRLRARDGSQYYLKRPETIQHYYAEVRALQEWLPSLAETHWWRGPQVIASSDDLGVLIMTRLPGDILESVAVLPESEILAYRLAGRFASRLHSLKVDLSRESKVQDYSRPVLDRYLGLATGAVDDATLAWAESLFCAPGVWDGLALVPLHCDFSPRNWLVGSGDFAIGIIDWERSRPGFWVEDFQRMTHDHWHHRPGLRDAFFEGYGRLPAEREWRQANLVTLINAIGGVPWAASRGDTQFESYNRSLIETFRRTL